MRDLRERLLRLERGPTDAPPSPAPALEPRVDELRRRLDRLLGPGRVVAATDLPQPSRQDRREELARFVGGGPRPTDSGVTYAAESVCEGGTCHGRLPLRALQDLPGRGVRTLFPETLGAVDSAREVAFLDTETTGLDGGAGTIPFLVGVARWTEAGFVVTQLFLEDLDREQHLLEALASLLCGVRCVVTYNGGPFDLPLLQNRHVLQRCPWPLSGVAHLDLLPAARTLWGFRHSDCRLSTLERTVLAFRRTDDVPSWEIPSIYQRFLRRGPDEQLAAVFTHNRWDLLSLAGLLWAAGRASEGFREGTGAGIGLLHARRGRRHEARCALEESLAEALPREVRARALKELSLACKREGEWPRALELWEELRKLCPAGEPFPVEEPAKALEHHLGDPRGALALVEEALGGGFWSASDREALERRRTRLRRKLGLESPG